MRTSDFLKTALPALATFARAADSSETFPLYAYGPDIGGFPLFSSGDEIYAGNFSRFDNPQAAPLLFTFSDDDKMIGYPNTTGLPGDDAPAWSNNMLVVPGPSSASKSVRLVNETADASNFVSKFFFYGTFCMAEEDGDMLSLWYRIDTDIEGVYAIGWNASTSINSDEVVPLTLKKTPPSNPTD